jgi:TRAP-type uncharacterized transport system substrate-binding protein
MTQKYYGGSAIVSRFATWRRSRTCVFALVCLACAHCSAVFAQDAGTDRIERRAAANVAAVMLVADHADTTMMKIADDLSIALQDADSGFRVVPVVGDGAEQNLRDLVLLRNIDVGITDLPTYERVKRSKEVSQNLALELAHLATLFPDKIQLIARTGIKTASELTGKRVGVGLKQSGAAAHANEIFKALGVQPVLVNLAAIDAASALLEGEIDAFICFCLSSPGIYQQMMFNVDLHVLPIPFKGALQREYLPASVTHEEFPAFISKGESIDTVAVTLVLVSYNWPKANPRYTRVATFVQRMFDNLGVLQQPPRHKEWCSVEISASVPGWPRFTAAAEWLAAQRQVAIQDMPVAFDQFLSRWTEEAATVQPPETTKLFEEFLQWRQSAR